ncbi:MAG: histidine--tRNA ligase [Clostridia bacterium]|nr:histidine--tRNA ligase [Clostridia bacterium]MDE7328145.1 histidine--tRNA ligase [Clostridia bacterium]
MINVPKGTKDVLPQESYKWHFVEGVVREVAKLFCVNEIRTPTFEHTELFLRGVGDTTDIVNKEMYTFDDKGGRSMTLKPEGTAGVARAFIENSLYGNAQPTKMYYITPVFRYEKPQAGRLREHHQFGIEYYGAESPSADVEVILLAKTIFDKLGVGKLSLNINSIGCPTCRKTYNDALKSYLGSKLNDMCATCRERFEKNPLRILDCKEEACKAVTKDAPNVIDYLCDDCKAHHESVCKGLQASGVEYKINPRIVRGLDYYTRTVFEFVSENIGAQGTVCGGGRYNGLVEQVGGKPCPAVGFGMGLERLILVLESLGLSVGREYAPTVYIAPLCDSAREITPSIAMDLRKSGISVDYDIMNRGFKPQLKYADKLNAKYLVLIGEDEMAAKAVAVKDMESGVQEKVSLDGLVTYICQAKRG